MAYTTQAEIQGLFSQVGVMIRLDDLDPPGFKNALEGFIDEATGIIDQYAQYFYDPADLANSTWVRRRCTWIACFLLSQRKGNPALFFRRYEEILDELERVKIGDLMIPGLPTSADLTPAMSNLTVDERFHVRKLRVHTSISAGGTSSRQDIAPFLPYEWL